MEKILLISFVILFYEISFCDCYSEGNNESGSFIPKCCPYGSSIVLVPIENSFSPECRNTSGSTTWIGFLYDKQYLQPLTLDETINHLHYRQKILNCQYELIKPGIQNSENHRIKLFSDGTAVWFCKKCPCKKWQPMPKEFCIDGLGNESSLTTMYYSGNEDDQIVGLCPDPVQTTGILHTWTFFISSGFYFITVVVYALLWETQNIHGWIIFSLVLSRFLMCTFLGTGNLIILNPRSADDNTFMCSAIGILAHFFVISSFSWLSVINFDFWLTFRTFKPLGQSGNLIRLMTYQALGWGFPVLIVGISLIMDNIYRDTDVEIPIPDYGNGFCFVTPCSRGPYIYFVLALLLSLSFTFSMLTLSIIYKLRRDTASIRRSKSTVDIKGYLLFTKLSVVMGTTWIFELISWALTADGKSEHWIWSFIDHFNIIITSVAIFAIFICKRKIIDQLKRKYHAFEVVTSFTQYLLSYLPSLTNWFKKPTARSDIIDLPSTDATSLPINPKNKPYSPMVNMKQEELHL